MTTTFRAKLIRWAVPVSVAAALATTPLPSAQAASTLTSKVVSVAHTAFTVKVGSQGDGWKYRLYASTQKADVYYDNLPAAPPYHSALTPKTRLTVDLGKYTTKPLWWRVQAYKGSLKRTGDLFSVGLRPGKPTNLSVNLVAGRGLSLNWAGSSNGYQIQQATDASFTTGVKKYAMRGTGTQFTPYGLSVGQSYFFRVRSANSGTTSAWTSAVTQTMAAHEQAVRVGTFNLHTASASNNDIPSWTKRRDAVLASVKQGGEPPILAIQEGDGWVDKECGPRQVDDLASMLGNKWKVAHTEPVPCVEHPWKRTGVYVIYDSTQYRAVGDGGTWNVTSPKSPDVNLCAYQVLENIQSGGQVLVVSVHLQKGQDAVTDKARELEMQNLVDDVAGLHANLPVIYAGDTNSHDRRPLDGPGIVMRKSNIADGWFVAPKRVNSTYNSANAYLRKPPRTSTSIDHISGSPGVSIQTWELIIKLKDGKYVGVIPSDHNMVAGNVRYPY